MEECEGEEALHREDGGLKVVEGEGRLGVFEREEYKGGL